MIMNLNGIINEEINRNNYDYTGIVNFIQVVKGEDSCKQGYRFKGKHQQKSGK